MSSLCVSLTAQSSVAKVFRGTMRGASNARKVPRDVLPLSKGAQRTNAHGFEKGTSTSMNFNYLGKGHLQKISG